MSRDWFVDWCVPIVAVIFGCVVASIVLPVFYLVGPASGYATFAFLLVLAGIIGWRLEGWRQRQCRK